MIELEHIPNEYKTDHLLLLVGANPLPNYVAARLLAKPKGTIHLLHTAATISFAKSLASLVEDSSSRPKVIYWQTDMVDGANIRQQLKQILAEIARDTTVGLHYTGGTKAMAVHAYNKLAELRPNTVFSYLDAQTLSMRIENADASRIRSYSVRMACKISLEELMQLHGYGLQTGIRTTAKQQEVISALATVYAQKNSYNAYRTWFERAFPRENSEENALAAVSELLINPELAPVAQALRGIDTEVTSETLAIVAEAKNFRSAATWFNGIWLEEYTLLHLNQAANELGISNYTIDLQAKKGGFKHKKDKREFQIDLAALWGYQLFAFSCRATDQTDQAKEHLLEVVIRARQLGGDEAKAALICCSDRPETLEIEVNETWFQGERSNQLRVFGRRHLPNLAQHLRDWFVSVDKR